MPNSGVREFYVDKTRFCEDATYDEAKISEKRRSLNRYCFVISDAETYQKIIDMYSSNEFIQKRMGEEFFISKIINRFRVQDSSNFGDMCVFINNENGIMAAQRVYHQGMFEANQESLKFNSSLSAFKAVKGLSQDAYFVIACDNFYYGASNSRKVIVGFPDFPTAKLYAELRMMNQMWALKKISDTYRTIKQNWFLFGENLIVAHSGNDKSYYCTGDDLESFLVAVEEYFESDWWQFHSEFELQYYSMGCPFDLEDKIPMREIPSI